VENEEEKSQIFDLYHNMTYTISSTNNITIMTHQTGTTTISCTIPTDLGEQLKLISELEERSKSYYVKKALESFLEDRLEDALLAKMGDEAYKEYMDGGQETISFDDIRKEIFDK